MGLSCKEVGNYLISLGEASVSFLEQRFGIRLRRHDRETKRVVPGCDGNRMTDVTFAYEGSNMPEFGSD